MTVKTHKEMTGCIQGEELAPWGSQTLLQTFEGKHFWTINNWKSYVDCSPAGATLYSEVFTVSTVNGKLTRWQIKAYPKESHHGHQYLAFRLICLDEETPLGSFHFVTYTKGWIWGRRAHFRFAPLPLDAAARYSTCIRLHPSHDLTICAKIKIVANPGDEYKLAPSPRDMAGLPLYEAVANAPPNPYLESSEGLVMPILEDEDEAASQLEPGD